MKQRRVILAVDPYSDDGLPLQRIACAIGAWTKNRKTVIEPVAVVSKHDLTLGYVFQSDCKAFSRELQVRLKRQLAHTPLREVVEPVCLLSPSGRIRSMVKTLIDYARRSKADGIALVTHSRTGAKRFFLGSFAETAALYSSVPLLIVNPKQKKMASQLQHILVPTDLSPASRAGIEKVSRLLDHRPAVITLFNQLEPVPEVPIEGVGAWPTPEYPTREDVQRRMKTGKAWAERFSKAHRGLRYRFLMGPRPAPIVPAILSAARRLDPDLIAMTSEHGPVSSVLLGSLSRQVLREASCPVWIVRGKRS